MRSFSTAWLSIFNRIWMTNLAEIILHALWSCSEKFKWNPQSGSLGCKWIHFGAMNRTAWLSSSLSLYLFCHGTYSRIQDVSPQEIPSDSSSSKPHVQLKAKNSRHLANRRSFDGKSPAMFIILWHFLTFPCLSRQLSIYRPSESMESLAPGSRD